MFVCIFVCTVYRPGPWRKSNKVSVPPSGPGQCYRGVFKATSLSALGPQEKPCFLVKIQADFTEQIYNAFIIMSLHEFERVQC